MFLLKIGAKQRLDPIPNKLLDFADEIHIPVAKFNTGDPQPDYKEIKEAFSQHYKQIRGSIAEKYWTITLNQMAHCGIKKYGDVNNLDKKRLNLHERIIHALIILPSGCQVDQYPLGGIFTVNPFFDVVCGYVFTAWQDVSYVPQPGISHVAIFKKIDNIPKHRQISRNQDSYLNSKENVSDIMDVSTQNGLRKMRLIICNQNNKIHPEHQVILEDIEANVGYALDLVKIRKVPEAPPQTSGLYDMLPSWDSVMSYVPTLTYLDEAWEEEN